MSNEIVPLDVAASLALVSAMKELVGRLRQDVLVNEVDYGVIPGTGTKPVLLLPGMEKLLRALRLRPEYIDRRSIVDFDKPLFFFQYECRLHEIESGYMVSSAIGSANSHETKWRYRQANRVCPACHQETIIKGNTEYGGGWLCFKKKGGCGAKFKDGDAVIESQTIGRVENTDLADQLNTIDKIAQKRALSSAIKGAANVSEFFTVDLEDFAPLPEVPRLADNVVEGHVTVTHVTPPATKPNPLKNVVKLEDEPQWTADVAKAWRKEYAIYSDKDILTALGVTRLGEFQRGVMNATMLLSIWIQQQNTL